MNQKIIQPRQGRHSRKISLLTELNMFRVRVTTTMSRLRRWDSATETQRLTRHYQQKQAATGMVENNTAAKTGGRIAKRARLELESKTGRKVVSKENYLPPSKAAQQIK